MKRTFAVQCMTWPASEAFPLSPRVLDTSMNYRISYHTQKKPQYRGVDQDGNVKVEELTWGDLKTRFVGYRATHYVVSLSDEAVEKLRTKQVKEHIEKLRGKQVEIQVTSMAMYAWQEVNHDLNYKVSPSIEAVSGYADWIGKCTFSSIKSCSRECLLESPSRSHPRCLFTKHPVGSWLQQVIRWSFTGPIS